MSFDKKWESEIYKKGKQINKYPFDIVVSNVNTLFTNKKVLKLKAIELGCGTGNNLKFFLDFGFKHVTGIDGSKFAIKEAKKFLKKSKCQLVLKDFNKYNLGLEKYDLILDRGSITHNNSYDIKKIIKKVNLALTKDGYFISHLFSSKHSEFKKKKSKEAFKESMGIKDSIEASFFDKKKINKFFKDFKIISLRHSLNEDIKKNYKVSFWNIICKKKI